MIDKLQIINYYIPLQGRRNKMKYKLSKLVCTAAIVSTIMPLSACQKESEDITFSRQNELTHLINPMDWSNTPDYVNLEMKDNYIVMDIDTFYRLLNKNDKDFIITLGDNQIVLDKQTIKEKIDQEFYEYNSLSIKDYIKVTITIAEGVILLIIVNKMISLYENSKEKIKKLS